MEAPARIELATYGLGNRCSIHLSYGAIVLTMFLLFQFTTAVPEASNSSIALFKLQFSLN